MNHSRENVGDGFPVPQDSIKLGVLLEVRGKIFDPFFWQPQAAMNNEIWRLKRGKCSEKGIGFSVRRSKDLYNNKCVVCGGFGSIRYI